MRGVPRIYFNGGKIKFFSILLPFFISPFRAKINKNRGLFIVSSPTKWSVQDLFNQEHQFVFYFPFNLREILKSSEAYGTYAPMLYTKND